VTIISLGPVLNSDPFTYSGESSFSLAVRYLYSIDLNSDGLDELIFAGFETQFNTPAQYTNTKLSIYGWNNGQFSNLTTKWLPNGANLVEGVADVGFGDFNGDSFLDIFLSAYTDMNHPVNAYSLINKGGYFEKINLGSAIWQHGVAVADINKDGFSDVFASGYDNLTIYLGSSVGLKTTALGRGVGWPGNGSDIELADFLGNGTITAITVDSYINGTDDFGLFKFKSDFNLELFSVLPQSRLGKNGHDVRVKAFDFSHDGLMDAIVFTRASYNGTTWPKLSQIQFLENQGNGNFKDVTTTRLIGYEQNSNASYTPNFVDINLDGIVDIFMSEASWGDKYQSTSILMGQHDGSFIDTGRLQLSSYITHGQIAALVRGANNQFHMVIEGHQYGSGNGTVKTVALSFPERNQAEILNGTNTDNVIYGLGGNDHIIGKKGNDSLDGGFGLDTAQYMGIISDYTVSVDPIITRVFDKITNRDGTDTLTNIERLQFTDKNIALDLAPTQAAGQTALLIGAVLPGQLVYDVSKQALLGSVIGLFDQGFTLNQLSGALLRLPVWDVLTGKAAPTNADIASYLVNNVYGGKQTTAITNAAIAAMNAETPTTQGTYLASLAASTANQTHVDLVGVQATGLVYGG